MKRIVLLLIGLLILLLAGWYFLVRDVGPIDGKVVFTRQGMNLELFCPKEVKKITVSNKEGKPLTTIIVGPGKKDNIPLFIKWIPTSVYSLQIELANGSKEVWQAVSPDEALEKVSFSLQAPYGLKNAGSGGTVPVNSVFTASLLLTNHSEEPITVNLDVKLPQDITVSGLPAGLKTEIKEGYVHITGQRRLSVQNENWSEQIRLQAGVEGNKSTLQAVASIGNDQEEWQINREAVLQVASAASISSNIKIMSLELPVDATGRFDAKARQGSLIYLPPSRLGNIVGHIGKLSQLDDEPFAYTGVKIANDGETEMMVLVAAKIKEIGSSILAPAFLSPPHKNAGLGYSYGIVSIPAHGVSKVVLPIYLDENNVLPGNYELQAEASVFGVNQVLSSSSTKLELTTRNDWPLVITLLMTIMAIVGIGWLLWRQEVAFANFSTKELVTVSLFGAVTFVTVNLPSTIFWDLAHVFLGPFSFFFTGFFNETVLYTLLVSLIMILPKPGTITLMVIVRMILTGFIFGHFTPAQVLSYVALAVCLEIGFYMVGATRRSFGGSKGDILKMAVICGLVDVVTAYMNFMAFMTLYRLFYADWYIWAVALTGFIYTAIGAAAGCRLGASLKRTALD